jgi:hypothetical protein
MPVTFTSGLVSVKGLGMKRWAVFWACLSVVPISFDTPQDTAPIDIHAQRPAAPAGSSERSGSPDDPADAPDLWPRSTRFDSLPSNRRWSVTGTRPSPHH